MGTKRRKRGPKAKKETMRRVKKRTGSHSIKKTLAEAKEPQEGWRGSLM